MAELDITKIVEEITMKAREEGDRFIFETVRPYCEEVMKQEISKHDLEEALLQYFGKKPDDVPNITEEGKKWCENCMHVEVCAWYGYEGCEFRDLPKTGQWIDWTDDRNDYIKCSHCGYGEEGELKHGEATNFCPNCGSYNGEVEE